METLTGERISYIRFLTDALVLIHHVQYDTTDRFRGASALMRAFGPYFTDGDWYKRWKDEALQLMGVADLQLYDFYRGSVRSHADGMAVVSPGTHIYSFRVTKSATGEYSLPSCRTFGRYNLSSYQTA